MAQKPLRMAKTISAAFNKFDDLFLTESLTQTKLEKHTTKFIIPTYKFIQNSSLFFRVSISKFLF